MSMIISINLSWFIHEKIKKYKYIELIKNNSLRRLGRLWGLLMRLLKHREDWWFRKWHSILTIIKLHHLIIIDIVHIFQVELIMLSVPGLVRILIIHSRINICIGLIFIIIHLISISVMLLLPCSLSMVGFMLKTCFSFRYILFFSHHKVRFYILWAILVLWLGWTHTIISFSLLWAFIFDTLYVFLC